MTDSPFIKEAKYLKKAPLWNRELDVAILLLVSTVAE